MPGPTTQSQLSPNTVACDGGLDLISPKINVNAGSLNGCLNFERTDRVGYSRIYGYEPFDGGPLASLSYTNLAVLVHDTNATAVGTREEVHLAGEPALGFVARKEDDTHTTIVVTDFDQWRSLQADIPVAVTTESAVTLNVTAILDFDTWWASTQLDPSAVDAEALMTARNILFTIMRDDAKLPGEDGKPVIGLHGYKDQVYAIKDLSVFNFDQGSAEIRSGDQIRPHADSDDSHLLTVLNVNLKTGDWGTSDAAGTILVQVAQDASVPNGKYDNRLPVTPVANAIRITGLSADSADFAGLWRSNDYQQAIDNSVDVGWSPVELGYTMGFINGQSNGPFRVARRGSFSDFSTDVISSTGDGTVGSTSDSEDSGNPVPGDSWVFQNGTDVVDIFSVHDTTSYVRRIISNSVSNNSYTPGNIYISNFPAFSGFSGTASLDVKGVEITVVCRPARTNLGILNRFSIAVQPVISDTTLMPGTSPRTAVIDVNYDGSSNQTIQAFTFGGPTDLWDLDAATMKGFMDSGWGWAIQPWVQIIDGQRQGIIDTFYVLVKVYYEADVTAYYFWNGSDDVTADITGYFVTDGDWTTNDAEGVVQVTNVVPVGSANRRAITNGDEVRTDPGGAGLLIAEIKGDMTLNGLDPLSGLLDNNSRYEIITANFYADAEFEAMYGVSGAGRAWSYDGFYFDRIFTQADATKDKPRHILDHQFHLALGYNSGSVLLSELGNPQGFDGQLGATEIATGDPVTGLIRMQGTTLGVFGKKTVQGIIGTSIDNFSLSILGPYEGAIEYTLIDVGGRPVYCSYRGISFFDQTAAYGDFAGSRLSVPVSPWLLPRLQGTVSPLGTTASSFGPVCAVACRQKNQYRLYFQDGARLTMTLVDGTTPQFTFQAEGLYNGFGGWQTYVVPRAETSFVDSKGSEHIYIAHYSSFSGAPSGKYYVYEYDRSWTFDQHGIPAYLVLNENFYGSIFDVDTLKTIRVHGLSYGYAPMTVTVRTNYGDNTSANQNPVRLGPLNLPQVPTDTMELDYTPFTNITNYASRGVSFNYRFMSYTTTDNPATSKEPLQAAICPPFVIQGLLVQITENKGDGNAS